MAQSLWSNERGSTAVELAVALPLLLLILLGTADFGRIFAASVAVQNAARNGAQWATTDPGRATDFAGAQAAALADAAGFTGTTAVASRFCTCSYGPPSDCSTTCSGKRTYVQVVVTHTFKPLVSYTGIPATTVLTGKAVMRVK
jgi:Flp pilus assembly protein TadG